MTKDMDIRRILSRRYDLSTFVVHLTRNYEDSEPEDNLRSILTMRKMEARSVRGIAESYVKGHEAAERSQRAVSFSEAPLDQLWSFVAETDPPRRIRLSSYGLAFPRQIARSLGANPVWYIDKTVGRGTWLHGPIGEGNPFNKLIEEEPAETYHERPISKITPFVEPMGTWESSQREFYWEREWRKVGDVNFGYGDIAFGLCPEGDVLEFEEWVESTGKNKGRKYALRFVDPMWGLEEILAVLSGLKWSDFSPFMKDTDD